MSPAALIVNTINKRSPAATGIGAKLAVALDVSPMATVPVRGGIRSTDAPVAVKTLLPAGARYTCALIVTVVPTSVSPSSSVKDAEIAVMLPALGTEKASVTTPDKSIVFPATETPGMAVPNPTRLAVPTRPPAIEVNIAVVTPEENGMIEPVLAGGTIQAASIALKGPRSVQLIGPVGGINGGKLDFP